MNDLNHLLHDWAARQEPTPAELDSLQARIAEQLANDVARTPTSEQTSPAGRTDVGVRSTRSASVIALVVVAASLLAAVSVFWFGRREDSARSLDVDVASLPAGNLSARQSLFSELDRMFNGHWRWLSEVNGRVHLETDEPSASLVDLPNDESSGIAVRLTIVQRRLGETKWTVVWEASVLARSEEWVRLPVELPGHSAVSMWAYALPDGSTLVESDVALTVPVSVRLSEQHVFGVSGRPTRLWSARRSDSEFQLIQSVARMEAHHG
ncbi:MAG: hypothetical protein IAG10_31310 [Planctomycetaceae bacterium]|nr:hypothetical protein [Planctomycetaceae bacterium]